jgi:predicted acyltransferase
MTTVPVPGYGPCRLDVEGNFAHYVDRLVLGSHNYARTKTWDPEGVVSTIPAIATTLLGVLAGYLLKLRRPFFQRALSLLAAGILLVSAGSVFNNWMPINKKLWSVSFCLFMAGLDFIVYAALAWLIDGLGWRKAVKPLAILGMNAIAVYLLSELTAEVLSAIRWSSAAGPVSLQKYLYRTMFTPLGSPPVASLYYSLAFTAAMYLAAYGMYRRGWFFRI